MVSIPRVIVLTLGGADGGRFWLGGPDGGSCRVWRLEGSLLLWYRTHGPDDPHPGDPHPDDYHVNLDHWCSQLPLPVTPQKEKVLQ